MCILVQEFLAGRFSNEKLFVGGYIVVYHCNEFYCRHLYLSGVWGTAVHRLPLKIKGKFSLVFIFWSLHNIAKQTNKSWLHEYRHSEIKLFENVKLQLTSNRVKMLSKLNARNKCRVDVAKVVKMWENYCEWDQL